MKKIKNLSNEIILLLKLPNEISTKILEHLNPRTLHHFMLQSYEMRQRITQNTFIWTKMLRAPIKSHDTETLIAAVRREKTVERRLRTGDGVKTHRYITMQADITHMQIYNGHSVTSSDDGSVCAVNLKNSKIKNFNGHSGGVWAFMGRNSLFATGSTDRTVIMWNFSTGLQTSVLHGHKSTVRVIKIKDDFVVSGGRDGDIRVWDRNGNCVFVLQGHTESIRAMDVDGDYLVSGSYDGAVLLWNIKNGKLVRRLVKHKQRVYTVLITKNYVVSGGQDSMIHISHRVLKNVYICNLHRGIVVFMEICYNRSTGDEEFLITAGSDGIVGIFRLKCGNLIHRIVHNKLISAIAVYNQHLFVGVDSTVKLYDIKSGRFVRTVLSDASQIYKIVVDGDVVVIGYKDSRVTAMVMDFGVL